MIAVDTSAIIAIVTEEAEAARFIDLIASLGAVVATPTLVEAATVLTRLPREQADAFLEGFVSDTQVEAVDFTLPMFRAAKAAYRTYGKGGGHPAQLNFGDCFSYGVAKTLGVPLLFKGNDFAHTDIVPAWRP